MESKNVHGLRYIRRSKINFMLMARTQGLPQFTDIFGFCHEGHPDGEFEMYFL